MNLVLDTNVLVAALVARGVCGDLLEHCVRTHTVVSSSALLDELRKVLTRKFRQRDADVRGAVGLFTETFTLVTPSVLDPPACRDPDDDLVLATAVAGRCSAVITGDQDLLVLDPFQHIRMLAPRGVLAVGKRAGPVTFRHPRLAREDISRCREFSAPHRHRHCGRQGSLLSRNLCSATAGDRLSARQGRAARDGFGVSQVG